jgi:hypothetical protein
MSILTITSGLYKVTAMCHTLAITFGSYDKVMADSFADNEAVHMLAHVLIYFELKSNAELLSQSLALCNRLDGPDHLV